jgi:hypothetical protein
MPRSSATITPAEVQEWAKFCQDNNIIQGQSEQGIQNANFALEYFTKTWGEDITPANLAAAKSVILPHLKQYAQDELDFHAALAKLSPTEQEAFASWIPPRGLVINNRGLTAIVEWIKAHGFNLTKENLQLAVGQQTVAPFLEWEHVSAHRETEHSRTDDGRGFLHDDGMTKQKDGTWGKSPAQYAKERREAQEKANPQTAEQKLSVEDASWRRVAEEACAYGSHSQQAQIRKVFQASVDAGLSWRKVCEACTALRNTFKKSEMVANRAGYYSR